MQIFTNEILYYSQILYKNYIESMWWSCLDELTGDNFKTCNTADKTLLYGLYVSAPDQQMAHIEAGLSK